MRTRARVAGFTMWLTARRQMTEQMEINSISVCFCPFYYALLLLLVLFFFLKKNCGSLDVQADLVARMPTKARPKPQIMDLGTPCQCGMHTQQHSRYLQHKLHMAAMKFVFLCILLSFLRTDKKKPERARARHLQQIEAHVSF